MRRICISPVTALIIAAFASPLLPADAAAGWPPPETATAADMSNPANWPNDPGYAYSDTDDGQWNYYSFIPTPSGSTMPRPEETASGMSIDLAWRYTIGDPRVLIAITDSGIEWDSADLVEKAYLNQSELANHKPRHADDSACGGTGDLAGFDCNEDGVLSVSDYAETPALMPPPAGNNPKGDKNQNGRLDAGDIILNFSDGIDDDNNGYVDDISGWDFMKDDNDPYDDTRYGHGTGEARDSVSQTNNALDSAGGCPLCRFIATRVGDSFITDVQDFSQAVVYATDMNASIVQCALGTINDSRFTQAALDYAYSKNVLVITSMADENSRHHNMPAANNHTLPVHAIQYSGSRVTNSKTFFAFHPCSNYGGQNLLSASGTGCSSEATGELSGIAGLVYSAAWKYGVTPPLTPGEAHSLFFTTADDIDVPESREEGAPYRYSQPGFDQRFGYGRVNANRAVEAVKNGRIPPAVDITAPEWFQVLYRDQVPGPIDVIGTVSAKRANSFDYFVEWAPGVQPLDGDFKVLKEEINLDPTTIAGASNPLASIDIRTLEVNHERDVDSPYGENDDTITVRVRAVAHYGGSIGDVPGEMRRTYYVHTDPSLVKGFPIYIGDSGEGNPKMADLDGDGIRDLVYPTGGGLLHAFKLTPAGPQALPGFPYKTSFIEGLASPAPTPSTPVYRNAPGYAPDTGIDVDLAREGLIGAPAIGDIDGDGTPEIVMSSFAGTIYVVGADGQDKSGWPKRLPSVPSCPLDGTLPPGPCMGEQTQVARGAFASPVLEDLNGDGNLDIIQAAFDGHIYVFDAAGQPVDGFPVELHYNGMLTGGQEPGRARILTTPAVGDFNGDGVPDLVVGSNEKLGSSGQAGAMYIVDGRGMNAPGGAILPNWPVTQASYDIFPLVAEGLPNSPVVGRFEGKLAAVFHGNGSVPLLLPADPGIQGTLAGAVEGSFPVRPDPDNPGKTLHGVDPSSIFGALSNATTPNTMLPLFAQPSLGDIDQDGVPDVITSGGSLSLVVNLQSKSVATAKADNLLAVWSGKTGRMMPGSPYLLEDFTFFNNQAIADLDGDDYPEIITGSGGYFVHAYDACGREPKGWPKFTGQWIIPTAAVGDLNGDGKLEVATGTRSGFLYAWHTEGNDQGVIEWESFHHDNRNTGSLETALEQGSAQKAPRPLTTELCIELTAKPAAVDEGGCQCAVGPGASESPIPGRSRQTAFVLLATGMAALLKRRRRH